MTRDEEIKACLIDTFQKFNKKIALEFIKSTEEWMGTCTSNMINTICAMTNINSHELTEAHIQMMGLELLKLGQMLIEKMIDQPVADYGVVIKNHGPTIQ